MSSDDANSISAKYADLLPQLSRSATRCVKLLSSALPATSNNNKEDAALTTTTTTTSKWPQGEEYEFHKAFRGFNSFIRNTQKQHEELLQHISVCYRDYAGGKSNSDSNATNINPVEAVDALFENVDHLLDSVRGVRVDADKQEEIRIGINGLASGKNNKNNQQQQQQQNPTGNNHSNILSRPQDSFAVPPDNFAEQFLHFVATSSDSSNKDDLHHHHHRQYVANAGDQPSQTLLPILDKFQWPDDHLVPPKSDKVFLALEQTPLTFIDTPELLQSVVATKLLDFSKTGGAIAVDVEHHSEYSYLGFTCLVQISTRDEDFVIDTIALHDDMWRLAPVFHDPRIVKVLHSAQEDVRWLQRDFGLYLVNLFDTAIALQTLRMPHSLAFLVDHICQVKLNKTHQNDDWRQRPLPQSMIAYARQDTHYLLYCWDRLRTMLATADTRGTNSVGNLLLYVLNESKRLAMTTYAKPAFRPETTWREVFGRSVAGLFPHQLKATQSLFNWREGRARSVDTSANAIMTNGQLLAIGCRLPSTAAEILRMANPATVEVRKHVRELIGYLEEARSLMTGNLPSAGATQSLNLTNNNKNADSGSSVGAGVPMPSFQAEHAIHQPMTGTLPSVVNKDSNSNRNHDDEIFTAAATSAANNLNQDAALTVANDTNWMNFFVVVSSTQTKKDTTHENSKNNTKTKKSSSSSSSAGSWNPQELAKTLHVPIPPGRLEIVSQISASNPNNNNNSKTSSDFTKLRREREGEANNSNKNDDEEEEDEKNVDEDAAPSDEGPKQPSNSANAASENTKQKSSGSTLPKSLAEEHGGLGRSTRKKAAVKK